MTRLYQLTLTGPEAVMLAALMPIASEMIGLGVQQTETGRAAAGAEFAFQLFRVIVSHRESWDNLNRKLAKLNSSVALVPSSDD